MFQKILVALDDSELSRTIFDRSLALAKAERSELMLVHILTLHDDFYPGNTFIGMPESAMRIYTERLEKREQAGVKKLRMFESEATAAGVSTELATQAR